MKHLQTAIQNIRAQCEYLRPAGIEKPPYLWRKFKSAADFEAIVPDVTILRGWASLRRERHLAALCDEFLKNFTHETKT